MRAAFTLIEVLAAVFLTAVVMTVAIAFSVNLNDSADAAAQKARQGRQALAVLDRVARDLEGAYLLSKPESLDPLGNPWIFVADSQTGDSASDRLQFVTRSYRPSNPLEHGSDLAVVSYLLHASPDAPGFDLLRSVSPGLPAGQNREFPSASDEAFILLAEGIDHFGLRFMSADFEWFEAWDSTQLEQSSALPRAAEIAIAYLPKLPPDADAFEDSYHGICVSLREAAPIILKKGQNEAPAAGVPRLHQFPVHLAHWGLAWCGLCRRLDVVRSLMDVAAGHGS